MKWSALIFLALLPGAMAGEAEKAIALGRAARADGVPDAAIYELKRVAGSKEKLENTGVLVELARCLIDAGREKEAAAWLRKTIYRDRPDVVFWRAQARAQAGDYAGALEDYTRAAEMDFALSGDARFGRARMLEALGRSPEALEIYLKIPAESPWHQRARLASAGIYIRENRLDEAKRLLDGLNGGSESERILRKYLLGRVALESGDAEAARRIYEKLAPHDPALAAGKVIAEADDFERSREEEKAESVLEAFVRDNPGNPLLGDVLAKLDEIRSKEKDPSNATLKRWADDDDNPELSATAAYYLARNDERQERTERAIRGYEDFLKRYPRHFLRVPATIRLARLLIEEKQIPAAIESLSAVDRPSDRAKQARLRFLKAATEYQSNDFPRAAKTFIRAANLDPSLSQSALANAALAAISAGNEPQAVEILNALRKRNAATARRIELAQAFQSARNGNPDAGEQLTWLADRGGGVGEKARLALAEWRWLANDASGAKLEFSRVANSASAGRADQQDYFAVYLADDGSEKAADAVSSAARDFLSKNPASPRAAEVRMKWGEVLMRSGDYRGARAKFEEAARDAADPGLKQSALFLAARAAVGSMDRAELEGAITLLEGVANDNKGESLAEQARLEQAMLQSALGRPEDSVKILDRLISVTQDPRLRFSARLKKGEALFAMGVKDKARLQEAVQEWRSIAAAPGVLPSERNEALTRAGEACEQAGDADGALAAYYEVLTAPRDQQPEYFWYYKAGFEAANLLIARNRFKEAAAIYEKMAATPGPRAGEFKDRVKRLRLENFIWED